MFITRCNPATDTKGSSITATTTVDGKRKQKTIPFPYAQGNPLNPAETHLVAVVALCEAINGGFTRSQVDSIGKIVYTERERGYSFDFQTV